MVPKRRLLCILLALALLLPLVPPARAGETTAPTQAETTAPTEDAVTTPAETEEAEETAETTLAAEATGATAETTAKLPTEAASTEPAPPLPEQGIVMFVCTQDITVTVYTDPQDPESVLMPTPEYPLLYLLYPGTYFYQAEAEGFLPAENQVFEVPETGVPLILRPELKPIAEDPDYFTVTYHPCGGTCSAVKARVAPGCSIGELPMPVREGWRFTGWYLGAESGDPVSKDFAITSDLTIYAHWTKSKDAGTHITFDPNGGELPQAICFAPVDSFNSSPLREGLSVFEWGNAVIDGGGATHQAAVSAEGKVTKLGSGLTVPEGGMVLSAAETALPTDSTAFIDSMEEGYWIGLDRQARTVSIYGTQDGLLAEHTYIAPGVPCGNLPVPTRDGKQFAGWYTHPQGGTQVSEGTILFDSVPDTLYAHWADRCSHSYSIEASRATSTQPAAVRYTCKKCKETFLVHFGSQWSQWSEKKPHGIDEALLETRTEYRCRLRQTTVSERSSLPGWSKSGTSSGWTDYTDWSDWSLTPAQWTCYTYISTTPLYRYYCYTCSKCDARTPQPGTCECSNAVFTWQELWSPIPYSESSAIPAENAPSRLAVSGLSDGQAWYFAAGNLEDTVLGTPEAGGDSPVIRLGFRTRTRTRTNLYDFSRWGDWGDWSVTPVEPSETVDVQTRTLYRSYIGELNPYAEDCRSCDAKK